MPPGPIPIPGKPNAPGEEDWLPVEGFAAGLEGVKAGASALNFNFLGVEISAGAAVVEDEAAGAGAGAGASAEESLMVSARKRIQGRAMDKQSEGQGKASQAREDRTSMTKINKGSLPLPKE